MPFAGLSIVFLLQIALVVHVIRTGRNTMWIWALLLLPAVGTIAYVVVEVLPQLMGSRGVRQGLRGLQRVADPNRDLRAAAAGAAVTDTVAAKLRLGEEQTRRGNFAAASETFRSGLKGLYEFDPTLLHGLAIAQHAAGDPTGARQSLGALRAHNPEFRSPDAHLLYARVLEELGELPAAEREYRGVAAYFPGAEAKVRHAQLLKRMGRGSDANQVFEDVQRSAAIAPSHVRRSQAEWFKIADRERPT
jgi:hypothetical protein